MKIPFELNGKVVHITFKELLARLWPWGKWHVVWKHVLDGEHLGKEPVSKKHAVQCYNMHKDFGFMKVVRIRKEGGLFHGIEYTPRTRKGKAV